MSIGAVFLIIACILFFLNGLGVRTIPGAGDFAHVCFVMGLLLGGYAFPWWPGPRP